MVAGIRLYRWVISPAKTFLFGPLGQCRFTPSCSAYALQAITRHGAGAGIWLALKRLLRCHPWGGCGDDPVPPLRGHQPGICQPNKTRSGRVNVAHHPCTASMTSLSHQGSDGSPCHS